MDKSNDSLLQKAMEGDINAFQQLFADFQAPLKSYLYRLLANRNDAEDLTHDTFIRAYDKLSLFKGTSSLKTWVFQIATNLAWNLLKKRKRWTEDVAAQAKTLVIHDAELAGKLVHLTETSPDTVYDIKEHIDTCFSCIGKNLPIENQIAVILKDVYTFSIKEIALIIDKTEGVVKYLLQDGRHTMQNIFTRRWRRR
ncbi:MAG: RNA polymerase sigma factor, partial [Bacteroidota bacterium]